MSKKKRMPKQTSQLPWQLIGMVPTPTLATRIDGMQEADVEQCKTLLEARPKPHVLVDGFTVNRIKQALITQRNDFWLFEEHLRRWQTESLPDGQRAEVTRLVEQMKTLRENHAKVLELANELATGTIETRRETSDELLGMEDFLRLMRREP